MTVVVSGFSRGQMKVVVSGFSRTVIAALSLLAVGCNSSTPAPRPAAEEAVAVSLQPVSLPDLAKADPAVADRIRAQHASVRAVTDRTDASDADRGRAFGELGTLLIAAQYLPEAEPPLQNARTLLPQDMRWPYYLGHLHRLQHATDKAIEAFERAHALSPDDVPTMVWLARLYVDQGRPDAAAPLLDRAVTLQPRSAAALFELGRIDLGKRDFARAADRLEAALRADAGAVQAHYPLAMAYRGLGRADEAAAHLKRWKDVELRPDDPLMDEIGALLRTAIDYEVRGTRALERRDWKDAIASFRAGLAGAPSDPSLHLNLGTALALSGDAEHAREEFERAIALSPGYARAHFTLGLLEAERGRLDAAVERLSDAVKYDPGFIDARFSLAELLRGTGRVEASLAHYLAIVKADPNSSQARFGYAMGLVRLGRYGEARDALAEATRAHPQQPGFAHALGRLLAAAPDPHVRDGAQALRLLEPLAAQSPSSTIAESMGMALAEAGRFSEAARWQREAIARATRETSTAAAERLRDNLRLYESGSPCRTPWREDDQVFTPALSGPPGK
jgi:tetratricopeptide (TPR) repeat protein